MQIGGDYPRPIMVNGYACNNCDDVSAAKRGQDPAEAPTGNDQAVEFGGSLAAGRGVDAVPRLAAPADLVDRYA